MDVKPTKGLKVKINAAREAVFGEEGVEVKKVSSPWKGPERDANRQDTRGLRRGRDHGFDGKSHWYPVDQMLTESGEKVVEEEITSRSRRIRKKKKSESFEAVVRARVFRTFQLSNLNWFPAPNQ